MTLTKVAQALFASLILAGCVLPEQSAGFTPPIVRDTENDPSEPKNVGIALGGSSGSQSASEAGGTTIGGGSALGGAATSGGGGETGGAAPATLGGASTIGGANSTVGDAGGTPAAGSTGAPCDYSKTDDLSCPKTNCAGVCGVSDVVPPSGTIPVNRNTLYGFQLVKLPPQSVVVALGAVTTTDPAIVPGIPGQFRLGLYEDNGGAPGALLGSTELLTANDASIPVQGALSTPVALEHNSNAVYWILLVTNNSNYVRLERYDVGQMQNIVFANNVTCLPLESPECAMPKTNPTLLQTVVPFLYARYLVAP